MSGLSNSDYNVLVGKMLRRPQPSDSEGDLLREQEQFLASRAQAAATVVRRPDKRRGEEGEGKGKNEEQKRDVVTIEGKDQSICFSFSFLVLRLNFHAACRSSGPTSIFNTSPSQEVSF